MTRRALLSLVASAAVDPERLLWKPGARLISIPKPQLFSAMYRFLDHESPMDLTVYASPTVPADCPHFCSNSPKQEGMTFAQAIEAAAQYAPALRDADSIRYIRAAIRLLDHGDCPPEFAVFGVSGIVRRGPLAIGVIRGSDMPW